MTGNAFDPIEIVEVRITHGEMSRAEVDRVLAIWRERLQVVRLPNGEQLTITETDIHHLILDSRILRKPERIERVLNGIFEIRTADAGRR